MKYLSYSKCHALTVALNPEETRCYTNKNILKGNVENGIKKKHFSELSIHYS